MNENENETPNNDINDNQIKSFYGDADISLPDDLLVPQVSDASGAGRVTDPDTDYGNDLDTEQTKFFDYGTNDDVYGHYY